MKQVILRAPLLSCSGYGNHSRQVYRWLLTRKDIQVTTQVVPWGMTSWLINPELEDGLIGKIMSDSRELKQRGDVSIQVQLPNEWNHGLANKNVGISAYVETDKCNPKWIASTNMMDRVIVPSMHVKQCIANTGAVKTDIHIVPESYYDEIRSSGHDNNFNLRVDTEFNFLVLGQLTGRNPYSDRKNTFNTVKWICEEFSGNKNVGIILKTNSGKNTKIDRTITEKLIKMLVTEVRKESFPRVHLLHGNMPPSEVASLYVHPNVSALVSLTRGEGYGLPLLEAAASGLPVIATNWSGHLDFLNKGKFIKVDYKLQQIHKSRVDGQLFLPEMKWAEPDEKDAKSRLRKFYESNSLPRQWAAELKEKIVQEYSFENICKMYDKAFEGII